MISIVGGKLDGQKSPVKCVTLTEKDETYILLSTKHEKKTFYWYQLAGMKPADSLKIFKERGGFE